MELEMAFAIICILLIVGMLPYLNEISKRKVTQKQRDASNDQFVQLDKGKTAYRWHGGVRGPVMVAVHGLTTPSEVWDDVIPELTSLGYRVLTYDLYGRGLSDAPRGPQTAAFFQEQLAGLLDALELDEDVALIGYSMGGAIISAFAAEQKHRVASVTLVASAGIEINETRFEKITRGVPIVGDWLAYAFLRGNLKREIDTSPDAAPLDKLRLAQLSRRGYVPAVHSSRKHFLGLAQRAEHRILSRDAVPVRAVWGAEDGIIPASAMGTLAQWNRNARQEVIAGAGHDLMQSHRKEVSDAIKQLLTKAPSEL